MQLQCTYYLQSYKEVVGDELLTTSPRDFLRGVYSEINCS